MNLSLTICREAAAERGAVSAAGASTMIMIGLLWLVAIAWLTEELDAAPLVDADR